MKKCVIRLPICKKKGPDKAKKIFSCRNHTITSYARETSWFSYLYLLTMWHYPKLISPTAGPAAANPLLLRQTDRQTPYCDMDPAVHTTRGVPLTSV